jgi:zinc-ribbon domain
LLIFFILITTIHIINFSEIAMFCHVCGQAITDGAQFCPHCGAAQSTSQATPAASPATFTAAPPPPVAYSMGQVISSTFADLKSNFLTHVVATLLTSIIGGFAFGLLVAPLQVGYMKLVERIEKGEAVTFTDIFKGFDHFVPALVAFLISAVITGIGFVFCIIPGLVLMPLIPLSLYLVAQGEKDGVQAVQRAWGHLKRNLLMAMITMIVLSALGSLGVIFCFVGIFLTLPLVYIGSYHMAKALVGEAGTA